MTSYSSVSRHTQPRARIVTVLATGVFLCGQWFAPAAHAQLVVSDPLNFGVAIKDFIEKVTVYGKEAARWKQQYDHYTQQLIRIQQLQLAQSNMRDDFPERDPAYGMEDICPGAKREGLAGAMSAFNPQLDSDLIAEQRRLCQRMVLADNAKYNESVRMLKQLIQRNREFSQVEGQRGQVGDSQGKLAANDNETQRFMVRTRMDLDYWQARMKAYDDYIVALQKDQARLARRALEGKRQGGVGQVIQSEAIKGALSF
ncbi:hypothetical protein [Lysobacter enzymogenes]|uniref:hypothetical protein n=1 Tax=Lysobacter enzymogenes TaxID=69 RepID=UPI00089589C0|nr:hypothetical protein [Lysobacter enzymogenes]SDX19135.1 hypothetical protein SAMN05421681_104165 [Lysobacter enzymogenes]